VITRFAIGYAPPGWDNVLKRFGGNQENRQSLASLIVGDQHAGINKRLAVFLIAAKTF
jgi:DNA primase